AEHLIFRIPPSSYRGAPTRCAPLAGRTFAPFRAAFQMAVFQSRRQPYSIGHQTEVYTGALVAFVLAALFGSGCSSSSTSIDGPSGTKCQVTVTSSMQSAPPAGGAGTLTVTTSRDCTWAVSTAASWIVITS